MKAKKYAKKIAEKKKLWFYRHLHVNDIHTNITKFLLLTKVREILTSRHKSWKPTAEYLNDFKNCNIPTHIFPPEMIRKTLRMAIEDNAEFMVEANNMADYYDSYS